MKGATLAAFAGTALRLLPGLAGAALVSLAAWLVFPPAGIALAGLFLLLVDRRLAA